MHKCSNCGISAKTKKKLKEHELLCKLEMKSIVVENIEPTNRQMWVLIQKLAKQNEILIKKVEELERVVHKDIKKINITEWLNKNIQVTITYSEWLNELNITVGDLKTQDIDLIRVGITVSRGQSDFQLHAILKLIKSKANAKHAYPVSILEIRENENLID